MSENLAAHSATVFTGEYFDSQIKKQKLDLFELFNHHERKQYHLVGTWKIKYKHQVYQDLILR